MRTIYNIIIITGLAISLSAQNNPESFLYANVTIHIGNGALIENGMVGVRDGRIDFVEAMETKVVDKYALVERFLF